MRTADIGMLAFLLIASASACSEHHRVGLRRADSTQLDAGSSSQGGARDAGAPGERDSGVRDSGMRDAGHFDAGRMDAGRMDVSMPEGGSLPTCDASACPRPGPSSAHDVQRLAEPCCTEEQGCGLLATRWYGMRGCVPILKGQPDPSCRDTTVDDDAGVLEGCCSTAGLCGHQDPELGCHLLFTADWYDPLRRCGVQRDPPAPNPFACVEEQSACTHDWECCQDPNYGSICTDGHTYGYDHDICMYDF